MILTGKFKTQEEYDFVCMAIGYTKLTPRQFVAAACLNEAIRIQQRMREIYDAGLSQQVQSSGDQPEGTPPVPDHTLQQAEEAGTGTGAE